MEEEVGIEPTATAAKTRCSATELPLIVGPVGLCQLVDRRRDAVQAQVRLAVGLVYGPDVEDRCARRDVPDGSAASFALLLFHDHLHRGLPAEIESATTSVTNWRSAC